jgi:hypothetical protein
VRVVRFALGTVLGTGAGLALEMALSAGFETGMGPGLDMGARRVAGKWEVRLSSMGDRDFTQHKFLWKQHLVPSTVAMEIKRYYTSLCST